MRLDELVASISTFNRLTGIEQIKIIAWYIHAYEKKEVITNNDIRTAFRTIHIEPPDVTVYLPRMAKGSAAVMLKARGGHMLSGVARHEMGGKYGHHPTTVAVTAVLTQLPSKVPNIDERTFLLEAINCYKVQAYRAATVMAWNLAFDHVRRWLMSDTARLAAFNNSLSTKYPKKGLSITAVEHFEELKESEVVETLKHAGLITNNVSGILKEKLNKRNQAAHPSSIEVTQHQADDTITDLVNNVVLTLV